MTEGNLAPPYRQLYFDRCVSLTRALPASSSPEIGEPTRYRRLDPTRSLSKRGFYKEWV